MGLGIGGIGAALDGAQQGLQNAQDRDFLQSQRAFQTQQEGRTQQQWQREDQQRSDIQGIDDSLPQDVQLRQAAVAYKQTDPQKWLQLHQQADQAMWQRSARQAQDLLASAGSMDAGQLATQATQIWNNSNMPVQLANPKYDENTGQVSVDVTSRDTGQTTTRTFANKDELLNSVRALTDPTTYANLQAERAKASMKVQEEQGKPVILPAGAQFVPGRGDARQPVTNDNGMVQVGTNADGTPILARATARIGPDGQPIAGGAGGAGAGAGRGTGVKANLEDAQGILDKTLGKADPEVQLQARNYAQAVATANPGMPAQTVAYVAGKAASSPQALQTHIDPATGTIDKTFVDPQVNGGKPLRVTPGAVKPGDKTLSDEDKKVLGAQVQAMAETWSPPLRTAIMNAAQDPKQMVALEQAITQRAQAANLSPQATAANIDAARNKVALAREYLVKPPSMVEAVKRAWNNTTPGAAPATAAAPGAGGSPVPRVGGLAAAASYTPEPGSPAAKAAANRAKVVQEQNAAATARTEQQNAEQQKLSAQFQADAKTMAPIDLVRKYDALRFKMLRDDAVALKNIEQKL